LVIIVSCLLRGVLLQPPWKELLAVWVVAWAGALCTLFAGSASRLALPSESVMLGALVCACAGLGVAALPRPQAGAAVAWAFEGKEQGTIISAPLAAGDCVYIAAAHGSGLQVWGALYCLDRATGQEVWHFDDDGAMKPVSISSPCLADGRLYIGEGFHQD